MKHAQRTLWFLVVQLMIFSACAPQSTATVAASSVPIDLAGPQMVVGSSWLYADGTVLVPVPNGPFIMGGDRPDNPKRPVTLGDFWIYSTKVTNAQYAYCAAMGLCTPPLLADDPGYNDTKHASDPMVGVTYDQAVAYCAFTHARLPTDAEWEKTARGPNGSTFPWGESAPSCDLLNYSTCVGATTPVNKYPGGQSYYHALDMEGNALEWVADYYQADYYLTAPSDNPRGPDKGHDRTVRSSAFDSGGDQAPSFMRFHSAPDTHRGNLSFRCVVDDPTYFASFCDYPATYGTDTFGGQPSDYPPDVVCPDLTITQDPECLGTTPTTHVSLPHVLITIVPAACHLPQNQHADEYDCDGPGKLVACAACLITPKSAPLCPQGYSYDETKKDCVRQASASGNCLPGYSPLHLQSNRPMLVTYLPTAAPSAAAGECCAYTPPQVDLGNGNAVCDKDANGVTTCHTPFSGCPVGTTLVGDVCVGGVVVKGMCNIVGIALNSCQGGGDQPICGGKTCGLNYILNPQTCNCDCNGC